MDELQKKGFLYLGVTVLLFVLDAILGRTLGTKGVALVILLVVELVAIGVGIASIVQGVRMIKKNMMLWGIVVLIVASLIVLIYVLAFVGGFLQGFSQSYQGATGGFVRILR